MNTDRLLSQFRISAAMRPYVLRLRLHGTDFDFGSNPNQAVSYSKCIRQMRRILEDTRRVPTLAADRAVLKSLEAAFDFQLADLRYRSLKEMEVYSHATLDRLIESLRKLKNAIGQLSPNSKGELNRRVGMIAVDRFNTETFIEIIETINAAARVTEPRGRAENIRSIIDHEPDRRSPLIDQWEAMPATTRVKVESVVPATMPGSLARWLDDLAGLLDQQRPARQRGAPHSISRLFVTRIATIWRALGLNVGLAYDFFLHPANAERIGRGGRVESRFQRYCRAALTAVGDSTRISARQITNYKRSGPTHEG